MYIAKRGTLHLGMRVEAAAALIAMTLVNINHDPRSGRPPAKMADFMLHVEKEDDMSVDSVFKKLGGRDG